MVAVPVSVTAFRGSRASRVYRITGSMNLEKGGKRMIDLEKRAKAWDEFSGEAREFTIGDTFNSAYELGVRDGAASVDRRAVVELLQAWMDWYDGPATQGISYITPPLTKTRDALAEMEENNENSKM